MIIPNSTHADRVLSAQFTKGIFTEIRNNFYINPRFSLLNYGKITRSVICTTVDFTFINYGLL